MLFRSFAVGSAATGCRAAATGATLRSVVTVDEAGPEGAATDMEAAGPDGADAAGRGAETAAAAGCVAATGAAARAADAADEGG